MQAEERNVLKSEFFDHLLSGNIKGARNKLSGKELSDSEVNEIAEKAFKQLLNDRKIPEALNVFNSFKINIESILNEMRNKFNVLVDDKSYINAFFLGKVFDLTKKRLLSVGLKGYGQLLSDNKLNSIIEIESEHKILHDEDLEDLDEKEVNYFVQLFNDRVISEYLNQNKIDKLYQIVDTFDIYRDYVHNPILSEIVTFLSRINSKGSQQNAGGWERTICISSCTKFQVARFGHSASDYI